MSDETIRVIVATTGVEDTSQSKGGLFIDEHGTIEAIQKDLLVSTLRENLASECRKFMTVIGDVEDSDAYKLSDVEVAFEISGEGGVSFIGTAKVGARASLKMKFARK
jgi:hypothetical protein